MHAKGILWLVLDEASKQALLAACPPRYQTTFYHHVTLRYGVPPAEFTQFVGQRCSIEAYEVCWDDRVQAVRVRTNGLPDQYGVPHVTLSTAEGILPSASIGMLQGEHRNQPLLPVLELTGAIAFQSFVPQVD